MTGQPNALFYGDNLDILRQHIADEQIPDCRCDLRPNALLKDMAAKGQTFYGKNARKMAA